MSAIVEALSKRVAQSHARDAMLNSLNPHDHAAGFASLSLGQSVSHIEVTRRMCLVRRQPSRMRTDAAHPNSVRSSHEPVSVARANGQRSLLRFVRCVRGRNARAIACVCVCACEPAGDAVDYAQV